ncbi:MAG TPA: ABC transporter ATP-binding protein [Candidatus Rifleibacterium sp.]|nr:ABC transporter ATP-binding protein [Candidatus Rifleibacterium sp.]HPT46361.1 ABC transporter ATP-binding protein [Candidatus Rifleibacterium sp.]
MMLTVENLCKNFATTQAVKDLTFRVSSGDITGFVGPNGAGKTTTLRIMATIEDPSSGAVCIDGQSITIHPEAARACIGFVPDSLPLHNDMSVHEYLDFFARAYEIPSARRHGLIDDLEEFTNLTGIREKLIVTLSKGMKQRVSIARALINDPQFLLMDEPAAGLDPRARIELRELLRVLSRQGKGILISSHILSELAEICTSALIIEQGMLLKFGTIEEVTNHGQAARRLIIRPISDLEALSRFLVLEPGVGGLVLNGRNLECDYSGKDEDASELLNRIIAANHRLIEFRFKQQNLESVFMNITRGEVQ